MCILYDGMCDIPSLYTVNMRTAHLMIKNNLKWWFSTEILQKSLISGLGTILICPDPVVEFSWEHIAPSTGSFQKVHPRPQQAAVGGSCNSRYPERFI